MLIAVGDDEIDSIKFPNGWSIHIEFGIDEYGPWGWRGRTSGKYRRVRLYDNENLLKSEVIEENPLYQPKKHMNFPAGDEIIY